MPQRVASLLTVMLFSLQSSRIRSLTALPISIKSPLNQIELLIVYVISLKNVNSRELTLKFLWLIIKLTQKSYEMRGIYYAKD